MTQKYLLVSIFALFALGNVNGHAESAKSGELGFGYGVGTSNEIGDLISDVLISSFGTTAENHKYSGAAYLNYSYRANSNLLVGAEVAFERIRKDIFRSNTNEGKQNDNAYTVAATAKYIYKENAKFRMYSGAAVGYTNIRREFNPRAESNLNKASESDSNFGFQITGIGFRFGSKLALDAELGFGYKGILNVGLSYQL